MLTQRAPCDSIVAELGTLVIARAARNAQPEIQSGAAETMSENPHGPTIFDKILDGALPCHKVYEDEHVLAFLDIFPLSPGHTLVIPKQRRAFLHELSDEQSAAIGRVLPRLAAAVMRATGAQSYNILQNNGAAAHQAVFHVHFHIIPRIANKGLGVQWRPGELSNSEAAELLTVIHRALD